MLRKYGTPIYRGSHIAHNELIEAIGFDGGSLNNERSVTFGGWPDVRILRAKKKVRKVDIKFLRQKCWVGPPKNSSGDCVGFWEGRLWLRQGGCGYIITIMTMVAVGNGGGGRVEGFGGGGQGEKNGRQQDDHW